MIKWIKNKLTKKKYKKPIALQSRMLDHGEYEVNGIVIHADNHLEAIQKYKRANDIESSY